VNGDVRADRERDEYNNNNNNINSNDGGRIINVGTRSESPDHAKGL
jgi:hypothetical protein